MLPRRRWGNLYRRRMRVFTLAVVIYLDYKALQQREKWISASKRAILWEKAHERNARRVLNAMIELEGLWVKLGQYLSTRADVLPRAYILLLRQLQDALPPRPLQEIRATIQKELGDTVDDLFSYFDEAPLATASIAQVHRATLLDGREVVVKVQHEGIKTIILEDLKNAKAIIDWVAWAEPQYNFNPMIDEWCKEAPKELDFNREAENTRTVAKNLGCNNKDGNNTLRNEVDVLIPEVIQATEKVLILEYMDGIRLNDREALEAAGVDKQRIVEEITRAYAHQIYVDGLFNGDPHPGNFLVSKEAPHRPILLDFGLTKEISTSLKQALAKMFLASVEGDHVALLSAFSEMGLKLRLDMPEQAMEVTNVFFRTATPATDPVENMKTLTEQRSKNMKVIQERMKLNQKDVKRFNPIDAFPGDIVIFGRVLNLLRGLSSTLNVRIVYQEIMRPFAESVLQGSIYKAPATNAQWIYDTPVHSDVEAKLRQLLVELGNQEKILGVQVCAYKEGKVIIDTAAGVLGRYDPRPVQLDSLFPVFSATKGVTAGLLHWLVDNEKLKLDDNVVNIWPEFGTNGKDLIKVNHILNHTSGLHNAMANLSGGNPLLMCDWKECLNQIALAEPETEPGREQLYHYLSYGWLCGGIIENASQKKFQDILEEAIVKPLNVDGELYVGIPPGVESRLASLTLDTNDLSKLSQTSNRTDLPSTFQPDRVGQMLTTLPALFNMLITRRAIIPAANGHCSARALARYYAALVDGGIIPPPHSSSSKPPLGSHPHSPKLGTLKHPKQKGKKRGQVIGPSNKKQSDDDDDDADSSDDENKEGNSSSRNTYSKLVNDDQRSGNWAAESTSHTELHENKTTRMYTNPRIHEAFLGIGEEYGGLTFPNGAFGLGFRRLRSKDGSIIGFGHSGMGGSTGFCYTKERFAMSVTVNKMSLGYATRRIIQLVCSELNLPLPEEFSLPMGGGTGETESSQGTPLIN
ncbi:Protein ACTIVITY OF BC1 COMPLEX KINASE 8, chloroplastic [Linum perenne]